VETTYLSAEQLLLLVAQSDPLMAKVRAEYEAEKAARSQEKPVEKAKPKTASGGTKKRQSVASQGSSTPAAKPKSGSCYDIYSQSYEPCPTTKKRSQASSSAGSTVAKPKPAIKSKQPCMKYDIYSQSFERCN
jgi:hypothetical protein